MLLLCSSQTIEQEWDLTFVRTADTTILSNTENLQNKCDRVGAQQRLGPAFDMVLPDCETASK